jgi:hypothetical protein
VSSIHYFLSLSLSLSLSLHIILIYLHTLVFFCTAPIRFEIFWALAEGSYSPSHTERESKRENRVNEECVIMGCDVSWTCRETLSALDSTSILIKFSSLEMDNWLVCSLTMSLSVFHSRSFLGIALSRVRNIHHFHATVGTLHSFVHSFIHLPHTLIFFISNNDTKWVLFFFVLNLMIWFFGGVCVFKGIRSLGNVVSVNFGAKPFEFNIREYQKRLAAENEIVKKKPWRPYSTCRM